MSQPKDSLDADFETQLRGLFQQAERALEQRGAESRSEPDPQVVDPQIEDDPALASAAGTSYPASTGAPLSLPQLLRPLAQGLEAISRATNENSALLKNLDSASSARASGTKDLPQIVSELRAMLELKNGVNQSMFAALHEELKGYKDGFLLESVHRPIIRDLISLYDDTTELQRQAFAAAAEASSVEDSPLAVRLRTLEMNLDHNLGFIIEVLARLEVTLMEPHLGKLDKRTQRAIAVELAEDPDKDGEVVRTARRGFMWAERVFRAEEVVVKKWKEGFLVALKPGAPK
jgi:molecular chaperone GrpE (heat shock protein)